jgi:Fe2+ transport system protein FeoA
MADASKQPAPTTLDALKPGGRGRIAAVTGSGGISRRLLDMGATRGTLVEVERVAPLGDPIEVRIRGYHLTLRKGEAERILVTVV